MGGRRHQRVMNGLVVVEVALCVVAMMGAGLLIHTFLRLMGVDLGFRPEGVVVASLSGPRFGEILRSKREVEIGQNSFGASKRSARRCLKARHILQHFSLFRV